MDPNKMSKEIENQLFWCEFSNAVSNFCLDLSLQANDSTKMVTSLVGEDLEWCGNYSFLFLATKYTEMTKRYHDIEQRCISFENMLSSESSSTSYLRKQIKQLQLLSQDNEWQLQEQVAHISSQLAQEKDVNNDIRHKLSVYEAKLIEVEMYLTSDKGVISLQLEQELAGSKLRIAELEAEKDEMELLENQRKNTSYGRKYDDRGDHVVGDKLHVHASEKSMSLFS